MLSLIRSREVSFLIISSTVIISIFQLVFSLSLSHWGSFLSSSPRQMQMEKSYCVVIIGAGLAGLACAKYLLEHDMDDILIVEASACIGGRCQTIQSGRFSLHWHSLRGDIF